MESELDYVPKLNWGLQVGDYVKHEVLTFTRQNKAVEPYIGCIDHFSPPCTLHSAIQVEEVVWIRWVCPNFAGPYYYYLSEMGHIRRISNTERDLYLLGMELS